jgi:hypothetical protein
MAIRLVYFEGPKGDILLPPTSDTPCPPGYILREANYINEVHELERKLQRQDMDRFEQQLERDYNVTEAKRAEVRRRLAARIDSCATDEYTKEFLRNWMMLRDEKRREYYKNQFRCREVYLEALHFDRPQTLGEVVKVSD